MTRLRVVGAGLPRTGTHSLQIALEHILSGRFYHMQEIPGHPFDLGEGRECALASETSSLGELLYGYVTSVDGTASMLGCELAKQIPKQSYCFRRAIPPRPSGKAPTPRSFLTRARPSNRARTKHIVCWICSNDSRSPRIGMT